MLNLTELGVEVFIKKSQAASLYSFWDNYDLIIWKKDLSGYSDKKGMFLKNLWGKAERISVSDQGIWKLPKKYVRYFK
jgi:hypothetical protein